jgi:NADH:ubiquinone oxidoreductase subunit F (NADH-binding)
MSTPAEVVVTPRPAPQGLPRVLSGGGDFGPASLREHIERYGPPPSVGRGRSDRAAFVEVVERSGLRGRGGGGFPTGLKLQAVAQGRRRAVVVANGAEGEPLSAKDKVMLTTSPHLVLDGAVLAASALRAADVIVVVDRTARDARVAVEHAVEERRAARLDPVSIRTVDSPTRYLAGEESALVHWLNGGPAKPTLVPPRPFERGVGGRPTLVQNVETLAHMALIARFGDAWFRSMGSRSEPGSALVTVGGAVADGGVLEISLGTRVATVIEAAGGVTEEISAFLIGGYFGTWLDAADGWDLALSNEGARAAGGGFGCGVVVALPATSCGLLETAGVMRYLAEETAGQCGPCVHGLGAIAQAIASIAHGGFGPGTVERLRRWIGDVSGRGACHYPDGAVRFVASALDVFADEIDRHARHHGCPRAPRERVLAFPHPAHREWGWR